MAAKFKNGFVSWEKESEHWLRKSLRFAVAGVKEKKQKKSLDGQLSLPGLEGEAERSMKSKTTRRKR